MSRPPLTLVIGGAGKTGRRVAAQLGALDVPVRIGSRGGEPPFRWDDPATWTPALSGVGRVYLTYPSPFTPGGAEQITAFAESAVALGVRRLAVLSSRGSYGVAMYEEGVIRSGADWTFVRPGWFNQNFDEGILLPQVRAGELLMSVGDVKEAFVDADDIAAVAVAALTDDKHLGRTYELAGPRLLGFADVAEELSRATGREIGYTSVSSDGWSAWMRENGFPHPDEAEKLEASYLNGDNSSLAHGVEEALGRAPKDFSEYARETAATGVWDV